MAGAYWVSYNVIGCAPPMTCISTKNRLAKQWSCEQVFWHLSSYNYTLCIACMKYVVCTIVHVLLHQSCSHHSNDFQLIYQLRCFSTTACLNGHHTLLGPHLLTVLVWKTLWNMPVVRSSLTDWAPHAWRQWGNGLNEDTHWARYVRLSKLTQYSIN